MRSTWVIAALVALQMTTIAAQVEIGPMLDDELLDPQDLQSLQLIRSSLEDMPGSNFFETWQFSNDGLPVYPCTSFNGVICDYIATDPGGEVRLRVRELNLGTGTADSPGLGGRLSPAIGSLAALQQLTLSPGEVQGDIPHTLGKLQYLQFLGLSRNLLSGAIPPTLASLPQLQTLDLSYNNLIGPVPPRLLLLPNLQALLLSHNRLIGSLPNTIASPLVHLDLQHNSLIGPLPYAFPTSISFISLANNALTGPLDTLASANNLYFLDLSYNNFSGAVPSALLSLPLHSLLLSHNALFGAVQPSSLVNMDTLDLSFNALSGPISPLLATVANLYLSNNRFSGQVPQEFLDQMLSGLLLNLFIPHNLVTDFPISPNTELPSTAALCVDLNCMATPAQSHCPDDLIAAFDNSNLAQCPP